MTRDRLDLLFVSPWPPSPATFGAQRRVEGLMVSLARQHRVSCVALVNPEFDMASAERAIRAYADEVVLVPSPPERGLGKRLLQLRSLASSSSFERRHFALRPLAQALDGVLRRRRYDVVSVESPHLIQHRVRQAPAGQALPRVLLDEHNIEFDLARQSRGASRGLLRQLHHTVNWQKIRREEIAAWHAADGVAFTSQDDAARARAVLPSVRAAVIPNAVDVEHFRPRRDLERPDASTVVFFGTLNYFPNQDAMLYFLREVWPVLERSHPRARLKVIGPQPTPEVLAYQGPRVEVAGLVPDLRPHLAEAACVIAPLRVGGGTRFKILEAMAMGKAIVSTTVGAEGIGAVPGRDLLIADEPASFASAVGRVLDDPELATSMGRSGRSLVEARYSWRAAGDDLERFLCELLADTAAPQLARSRA